MRRKSVLLAAASLLVGGALAGVLVLLLRHEPTFYRRALVRPGKERQERSRDFKAEFVQLINDIVNKRQWEARFTDEQLNSYFDEDYLHEQSGEKIVPLAEDIRSPRIAIEADKIRLAFRYGTEPWSTVISIALRVWLVPKEPNLVAVEFQSLHAGALPISAQSLTEQVYELARHRNIDVSWYRYNDNPVALLRFQADRTNPTFQMQRLELHQGMLVIGGRSIDTTPQAMLPAGEPEEVPR
jgi:hypothetical protein